MEDRKSVQRKALQIAVLLICNNSGSASKVPADNVLQMIMEMRVACVLIMTRDASKFAEDGRCNLYRGGGVPWRGIRQPNSALTRTCLFRAA